jgi:FdhD protein
VSVTVVPVPIGRVEGYTASRADDLLAVEEPLEIRLDTRSLSITMRTPGNDFELAAGFLFSEGMIRSIADIRSMDRLSDGSPNIVVVKLGGKAEQRNVQRNFLMTSACGVCGKASLQDLEANACPILAPDDIQIGPEIIHQLPDRLRHAQSVFDSTGGLHAAALFNLRGELESLREDIGRHNAVDKLIGAALLDHSTPMSSSMLAVSGRASFELVQKALMAGIPVMAAIGAPSSLAVATAEASGMTLIGFLRNGRFNVYTGSRRILGLEQINENTHPSKLVAPASVAEGSRSTA